MLMTAEPNALPFWPTDDPSTRARERPKELEKIEGFESTENVKKSIEQQPADHPDHNALSGQSSKELTKGKAQLWQASTAENNSASEAKTAHPEREVNKLQARRSHEVEEIRQNVQAKSGDLQRKDLLANPRLWEDFKKCSDLISLHRWAADHEIDMRTHPLMCFSRLCFAEQPLPALLSALEDAALGTPGNLNFLLDWQLRRQKGPRALRNRIKIDDLNLLQQWMRRQLHLGLKTEEDILVFLRFISRVSGATHDESLRCSLIASITEGLQSSSIFRFKDLGWETQRSLLESITRGPTTRESLQLGFSSIEAMQQWQLEHTDQMLSVLILGIVHADATLWEKQRTETRFLEVIPMLLEMIRGLPEKLAFSAILLTTKTLIKDHSPMPASSASKMHIWWSALAKTNLLEIGVKTPLKTVIELCLSSHKLEKVAPYLQQLDDRNKARFILTHWFRPKDGLLRARALHLFDEFCSAKRKERPWVSMFQAVCHCVKNSSELSNADVKQVFKVLQMLGKSEGIVDIMMQARKFRSIVVNSAVVYTIKEHLEAGSHLAERILHFRSSIQLDLYPELAEQMILCPWIYPGTALRYVQLRRMPFKRSSKLRVRLLERMAVAYSSASHITPRMALRYVRRCYALQVKERLGYPSVVMIRALTRAGLIRPLEAGQWVSTTQVRWILSLVHAKESAEVANKIDETVYKWRGANVRKSGPKVVG